jgi:hypothetical protein
MSHEAGSEHALRLLSRILAAALTLGGVIAAYAIGAAPASADLTPAAATAPGYAVEDFAYPQAERIYAERGILLKRGDGHIVLADCGSQSGLLEVWSRQSAEKYCFRVTGDHGYLSLELPSVYGIKGNDYTTEVNMTVDEEEKTFQVEKNSWTPVGESTDPNAREYALVEITATL